MPAELWLRPWAALESRWRITVNGSCLEVPKNQAASIYLWMPQNQVPRPVQDHSEPVARFNVRGDGQQGGEVETELRLIALPLDHRGLMLPLGGEALHLVWPSLPERPRGTAIDSPGDDRRGRELMLRAQAVWDRIRDVDDVLEFPANLWPALLAKWSKPEEREPRMDVIVRQARDLARLLEALERRARRILRRTHRMLPVGRIQEIDRRAMLWIARQPGMTLAEKAGPDQRLLAVAREENFDTLENRVLRAYCELARRHAADYLDRNRTRRRTQRARLVEDHARRCRRLSRILAEAGVRRAEPDATPNYVLMENSDYHGIWQAWHELLRVERVRDELWRWQPRSWEEFCTLALMAALAGLEGGRLVAAAPLWFRDEQSRGHWVDADSPFGVVHLQKAGLIVELSRGRAPEAQLARLGAPIWIRLGLLGDNQGFLRRLAVWPLWSPNVVPGDILAEEVEEIARVVRRGGAGKVIGGILMRPACDPDAAAFELRDGNLALAIGTEGRALADGLRALARHLASVLKAGRG